MEVRQSQFHLSPAVSVSEVGYHEDKNFPSRQNMEDCTSPFTQSTSPKITIKMMVQAYSPS